jgi:hypothetical protein
MKNFEEINFDSLHFNGVFSKCSLHYMIYQIYKRYDFRCHFHINLETMYNFSNEISKGYFKESKYHNLIHVTDSLQAMHYIISVGGLKSQLKELDIFCVFIANFIHDFEHPGFSN